MYSLIVGIVLITGCGHDGENIIQLRNMYITGYTSLTECREAGKEINRRFKCKEEPK